MINGLSYKVGLTWSEMTGKNIIIEGDSITAGIGASPDTERWSTKLCTTLGAIEVNRGVSSKALQWTGENCIYPKFSLGSLTPKGINDGLYILALGVNDILFNNGTFTAIKYTECIVLIIQTLKSIGWKSSEILILSPFYIAPSAYAVNVGNCSSVALDLIRINQYVDHSLVAVKKESALWLNIQSIYSVGSTTDGIHPNNAGHATIANYISQSSLNIYN